VQAVRLARLLTETPPSAPAGYAGRCSHAGKSEEGYLRYFRKNGRQA
jgi:hypothetical protein